MNYTVLLDSDTNVKESESEEKSKFIRSILESLNIDLTFWNSEELTLSIDNRIHMRKILSQYEIDIIEAADGELNIFFEKSKIGSWSKPTYILKRDCSNVDPKKQLYLEMCVNFTSIFDDDNNNMEVG